MSKNALKIAQGLRSITHRQSTLMSGTIVPGTVDENACTCSVLLTNMDEPIEGVMLNTVIDNSNGIIQFPADEADVIIGTLDGSGEYFLVRADALAKASVKIGQSIFIIDANGYKIEHNGESLTQILKDLLDKIVTITVPTGTGPSGTPINTADFNQIKIRLNNLLT